MRLPIAALAILIVLQLHAGATPAAAEAGCSPPAGFKDTPHPEIAPAEQLVSHTEEILVARAFPAVSASMNKPLNQSIRQSASLPGVAGVYLLTPGAFGAPGSKRIVCLTDGTTVEEQVLERTETDRSQHFRYVVWNYGTPKARPVAYGVGEFNIVQTGASQTHIRWTYSFKLKEHEFPGYLGAFGRWLFGVGFLDRDYAAMMRNTLNGNKMAAEALPANLVTPATH